VRPERNIGPLRRDASSGSKEKKKTEIDQGFKGEKLAEDHEGDRPNTKRG